MTVLLPLSLEIKICTHPVNLLAAWTKKLWGSVQLQGSLSLNVLCTTFCIGYTRAASHISQRLKATNLYLFVVIVIKACEVNQWTVLFSFRCTLDHRISEHVLLLSIINLSNLYKHSFNFCLDNRQFGIFTYVRAKYHVVNFS